LTQIAHRQKLVQSLGPGRPARAGRAARTARLARRLEGGPGHRGTEYRDQGHHDDTATVTVAVTKAMSTGAGPVLPRPLLSAPLRGAPRPAARTARWGPTPTRRPGASGAPGPGPGALEKKKKSESEWGVFSNPREDFERANRGAILADQKLGRS
jgi:hypothetical protein